MKISMIPLARREMLRAARWYESKAPDLSDRFLDEIRRAMRAVLEFPAAPPIIIAPYRRQLLKDFPYALVYRVENDEIVVLAVANLKRRPGYWIRRANI